MTAIGANIWIWESPITDRAIVEVAPRVKELGFDLIELPVEESGAWDPARAAGLLAELGLGAGVCCVMPPGRDQEEVERDRGPDPIQSAFAQRNEMGGRYATQLEALLGADLYERLPRGRGVAETPGAGDSED